MMGNSVEVRSRILGRVTTIVHCRRIQSLDVSQTLLQERLGVTNLSVAVASSITAAVIRIRGMEETDSRMLFEWVSRVQH
ncbi:MAG: PH domain-containing protein [Syntrophomonadaceae bacterium]|jgi:uncharacterized membrane protein YdbT with pleckstrin-like domain|nr:PH domain-containing protein [Syntrophomonadaceae bacterium]